MDEDEDDEEEGDEKDADDKAADADDNGRKLHAVVIRISRAL